MFVFIGIFRILDHFFFAFKLRQAFSPQNDGKTNRRSNRRNVSLTVQTFQFIKFTAKYDTAFIKYALKN